MSDRATFDLPSPAAGVRAVGLVVAGCAVFSGCKPEVSPPRDTGGGNDWDTEPHGHGTVDSDGTETDSSGDTEADDTDTDTGFEPLPGLSVVGNAGVLYDRYKDEGNGNFPELGYAMSVANDGGLLIGDFGCNPAERLYMWEGPVVGEQNVAGAAQIMGSEDAHPVGMLISKWKYGVTAELWVSATSTSIIAGFDEDPLNPVLTYDPGAAWVASPAGADLTGDGVEDIVFAFDDITGYPDYDTHDLRILDGTARGALGIGAEIARITRADGGPQTVIFRAPVDLGDVDGDGLSDLAAGGLGNTDWAIFHGPIGQVLSIADGDATVSGAEVGVYSPGDFDADGRDDLLGWYWQAATRAQSGSYRAFVIGVPANLSYSEADASLVLETNGNALYFSGAAGLSGPKDFDADGHPDLALPFWPNRDTDPYLDLASTIWIVQGPETGTLEHSVGDSSLVDLQTPKLVDNIAAPDLEGDGISDLAMKLDMHDDANGSSVLVIPGVTIAEYARGER